MKVTPTSLTIAEYCQQMQRNEIRVNRDYQRSAKVWPPNAKTYLIDTILLDYPMPKLSLYQRTDLKSRQTIKEIVDGQQRSMAIHEFFSNRLRLTTKSSFPGKVYSELDEPEQQQFLGYQLTIDLFVGATDAEIRQVFRRINSYNVPLNAQETRHATFQGEFKWFIVRLTERYAQSLKDMGVFTETQLTRMNDAALFAELVLAMLGGIKTSRPALLQDLYGSKDDAFVEATDMEARFDRALAAVLEWEEIHRGPLMRPYNFYALFLAVSHSLDPLGPLVEISPVRTQKVLRKEYCLPNLGLLAEALEDESQHGEIAEFVKAGQQATNTVRNRTIRFKWFCRALQPELLG